MRVIGTASVMRHGATSYTKVFPDLLEQGLPIVRATAREIAKRFPKRPVFISSPAERALGTAMYVVQAYGQVWSPELVTVEEALAPVQILNHELAFADFQRVTGHLGDWLEVIRVWDRFYMEHPQYEAGLYCERRSSTKARFERFIKQLRALCRPECHVVVVTHIELVGSVIHSWFGVDGDYFRPAEVTHLEFFENGSLRAEFRGQSRSITL